MYERLAMSVLLCSIPNDACHVTTRRLCHVTIRRLCHVTTHKDNMIATL